MNSNTFYLIVAIALGTAFVPLGMAAAFGQELEFEDAGNIDAMITYINDDVSDLVTEAKKFGFTFGEWVPVEQRLTLSGYEKNVAEDTITNITATYNFQLVEYDIHSHGAYFIAVYNGTMVA